VCEVTEWRYPQGFSLSRRCAIPRRTATEVLGVCLVAAVLTLPAAFCQERTKAKPTPSDAKKQVAPDPEPSATDEQSQVTAKITRWFDGKAAAVSLRFDDSNPTHILIAVPLLTQHQMVGTFLINPGRDGYKRHKDKWETEAIRGGHEFGNHTMHHRGAKDDEEADYEIGECSKFIWNLFPGKSKLLAFRSGGGTTWNIQKPWSHYNKKWHLVYDEHSLGVGTEGEGYVRSMPQFKERLDQALKSGLWVTFYYHQIGLEKGLGISEAFFREQVEHLRSRRDDLWFAGIAQAHKYQAERRAAKVSIRRLAERRLEIALAAGTDVALYDQALTMELAMTGTWRADRVKVADAQGRVLKTRTAQSEGRQVVRFEVPPVNGTMTVSGSESRR